MTGSGVPSRYSLSTCGISLQNVALGLLERRWLRRLAVVLHTGGEIEEQELEDLLLRRQRSVHAIDRERAAGGLVRDHVKVAEHDLPALLGVAGADRSVEAELL